MSNNDTLKLPETDEEIREAITFIRDNNVETYEKIKKALYSKKLNLSSAQLHSFTEMYLFIKYCIED
jgi:predicted transcriptional regulator